MKNTTATFKKAKEEKQKITMRQSIAGILLLLYLLLVFGSTVFTRMPGERQYQLEAFWSWKKILPTSLKRAG